MNRLTGSGRATVASHDAEKQSFARPWTLLLLALSYPFVWLLLAPETAADPWLWWWLAALPAVLVSALGVRRQAVGERMGPWLALSFCVISFQLFASAHVNSMHPFYALASATSVMGIALTLRSRAWLLGYFAAVAALCSISYAIDPHPHKLAYWGAGLALLLFAYSRLSTQLEVAKREREYRAQLEQQVAERTQDLQAANRRLQTEILQRERLEQEMRVVQKMEAVGRLTGGIAHEFNNLITTITVYSELLRREIPDDGALLRDVDQIQESAQEAAGLIKSLLSLSRPGWAERCAVDLNEVVSDMADLIRHLLGEHSDLDLSLADSARNVPASVDQIHQILINLVLNARDAMPKGGRLAIEVSELDRSVDLPAELANTPRDGPCAVLVVADDGDGMDEETCSRVFDPFFTTKDASRGTGLGLSTVYGIVTQAGGAIRVSSEPGEGTRFELFFPEVSEAENSAASDSPAMLPRQGSESILLVEDEKDLREALHRVLAFSGYRVVEANDGAEALEAVGSGGDFDLVVSDVVMPRMSGIELAERLRDVQPETRVLLLSGYLSHPTIENREIPDSAAFLAKPFTPGDLTNKVRSVLDGR